MMRKSVIEKYNYMDTVSSEEEWNDDFGIIIINVFERAVKNSETTKTVRQLINEIEIEFNKGRE